MNRFKRHWRRLPPHVRRPLVLTVGLSLIIAAAPIGAIPGPGGTIVFLLGIATLSSEFVWAERLRDRLVTLGRRLSDYLGAHPVLATIFWGAILAWLVIVVGFIFTQQ